MMTARFFSGASLFALLIVDICCLPVKKDSDGGASYSSGYTNAGPNFDSYQGALSGQASPGAVMPLNAPSAGVSTAYQAAPSASQPTFQRGPAASVGSSSSSGPVFSGSRGTSVRHSAGSAQPGAAFQPGLPDTTWAVAAPSLLSGGEEMAAGTRGGAFGQPQGVLPPGPMYQAGELSQFENIFEHGNSERETEEQGWLPPPPPFPYMQASAEQGSAGQLQPAPNMGGMWLPYPYDYMFLTGQYPPGTYTHSSNSFEQGSDSWQDAHYERYYYPANPSPSQKTAPVTPQAIMHPKTPVKSGYGQGGAQTGLPASHAGFRQPGHRQAAGRKGGY